MDTSRLVRASSFESRRVSAWKYSPPRAQRHGDLFQRRVAGALADAVDGAFDLAGAGLHRRQRIGDRLAQVVVTVHREHHVVDPRRVLGDVGHHATELFGLRVPHGVGEVDHRGAGLDGRAEDTADEVQVRTRGVHGRKLDVRGELRA